MSLDADNIVPITKPLKSLSDAELMLAYSGVQALLDVRIPAAVSYADSGVIYGDDNKQIARQITFAWLSVKGEALLTRTTKTEGEFVVDDIQTLAAGIANQYREQVIAAKSKH